MLISSAVVAVLGTLVIIPATMVVVQFDFNPIRIMTYIYLVVYAIYPKFEVVPPKP
ncbi:MAG: hypothetical protein GY810_16660 [Aureispira sp.]|nr:hypothetical protein [Aureispira sp.]